MADGKQIRPCPNPQPLSPNPRQKIEIAVGEPSPKKETAKGHLAGGPCLRCHGSCGEALGRSVSSCLTMNFNRGPETVDITQVNFLATSVERPIPRDSWMPVAQLQSSPVTPEYFIAPSTIEYHKRTRLQTQLLLRLAAVSAPVWITPGYHSPRCKNGSKSFATCLDVLDVPQLLLHLAAVSAAIWITPSHNIAGFKNGSQSLGSCLDVLDVPQLLLHLAAVSAVICTTPGHNSPRFQNGSKSTVICLDVLDVSQLLLRLAAVSAFFGITPGQNSPRFKNGSKSIFNCLDVLDFLQLLLHPAAVSAATWITPAPDSSMAAKAP